MHTMDKVDERIIAALSADARTSFAVIGAAVGLSATAVKRRVDRLRASGVIRRFTVVVDPDALGQTTEAFVEVYCRERTAPADILAAVRKLPEVVAAYTVTGDPDALVHLRTSSMRHLEEALERLRREPGVLRSRSTVVLSTLLSDD
ncbi:MAG TPA: Lrp/AsnC family transcriptional regulator [Mycobacteriales bacterium]|nr:Lrp/AsnC family transcriptional regulator [Mycobacteriales bacterium]